MDRGEPKARRVRSPPYERNHRRHSQARPGGCVGISDTPDDVAYTSLTADQIDMLRPHGRVIEYAKGDVLFVEGDTNEE